jgi:thiol-disulfide isomerase/thioredoxin
MKKQLILICFLSIISHLVISPFRSINLGGFPVSSVLGFTVFFYLTFYCLTKFSTISVFVCLITILLSSSFIELPIRIFDFNGTLISFPDFIIQKIAVCFGFLYWYLIKPANFLATLLGFSLPVFMFFQGYDYWLHYLNFNTFTGKISASKLQQTINGIDQNNTQINNQTLANKIVLLDFWHTRCGVCFQKFPQLQAFYDKYKNDNSIAVYAVNKPIEEDKQKSAFKVIEEESYNFPVLLPNDEELAEKFGVRVYPTTFVIDKQSNIVYKGDIEGAIRMIEELNR